MGDGQHKLMVVSKTGRVVEFFLGQVREISVCDIKTIFLIPFIFCLTSWHLSEGKPHRTVTVAALQITILFDRSNSMASKGRPALWKKAASQLIDMIHVYRTIVNKSLNQEIEVTVIPFADDVLDSEILPSETAFETIKVAFKPGVSMKTDFVPPLIKAKGLIEKSKNSNDETRKILILLTDGLPDQEETTLLPTEEGVDAYFSEFGRLSTVIKDINKQQVRMVIITFNPGQAEIIDKNGNKGFSSNIVERNWGKFKKMIDYLPINQESQINQINQNILSDYIVGRVQEKPSAEVNFLLFFFAPTIFLLTLLIFQKRRFKNLRSDLESKLKNQRQEIDGDKKYVRTKDQRSIMDELDEENKKMETLTSDDDWKENNTKAEEILQVCDRILKDVERLGDKAIEEIVERGRKAFENKILILEKKNQLEAYIYQIVQKNERIEIKLLAKHFVARWEKHPENVEEHIKRIYKVANNSNNKPLFFSELSRYQSNKSELIEITGFCRTIAEVFACSPFGHGNDSLYKEGMIEFFRFFTRLKYLHRNNNLLLKIGSKYYLFLLGLFEALDNTIYPDIDLTFLGSDVVIPDSWEKSSKYFQTISKAASIDKLKNSLKDIKLEEAIGPDLLICKAITDKWLAATESWDEQPAELQVECIPNLSPDEKNDSEVTEFFVVVKNKGKGRAVIKDIQILVDGEIKSKNFKEDINKTLKGVSTLLVRNRVEIFDLWENIEAKVQYRDYRKDTQSRKSPAYKKRYLKKAGNDFAALYQHNVPYRNENDVFEGRKKEYDELKNLIDTRLGRTIWIHGMRGVGKTSLINYFLIKQEKDSQGKNVAVNISCSVFNRNTPWGLEEFLAQIVKAIIWELEVNNLRSKVDPPEGEISMHGFHEIVTSLRNEPILKEKNLILFFDDIEIFFQVPEHPPAQKPLFADFRKIVKNLTLLANATKGEAGFFSVFSGCMGAIKEDIFELNEARAIEIRGLQKNETESICERFGLSFDQIALDSLWRLTGGHPALVQLFCQKLIQECQRENKYLDISTSLVGKISRLIVGDPNLQNYLNYLYTYSFSDKGRQVLETAIREQNINNITLTLFDTTLTEGELTHLTNDTIFEKKNGVSYLRIGILKQWIEKRESLSW